LVSNKGDPNRDSGKEPTIIKLGMRKESAGFKGFPEPMRLLRIGAEALAERRRQAR